VRSLFDVSSSEAVLLVDASNAFNSLNRETALHNCLISCPTLATVLINCYRFHSPLFIDSEVLLSSEGTTQGDPLAMAMYAIGVLPLIHHLNYISVYKSGMRMMRQVLDLCLHCGAGGMSFVI